MRAEKTLKTDVKNGKRLALEGANRCQAGLAGPGAAPAVGVEVIEERADQRRVELVD